MQLAQVMRPLHEATRFDKKQFAALLGLRAAASTFVPLLAGLAFDHPSYHWAGIAGFCATTTDKGGAYGTRARSFLALGLATLLVVFVGALTGDSLVSGVVVTFVVVTAGAMLRVLGNEAISVGTIASVLFLLSDAQPTVSAQAALERALIAVLGVGWAALLGLVVWPVRVFAPARRAVAQVFSAMGAHAREIVAHLDQVGSAKWHESLQKDHAAVRTATEQARAQLAAIRGNSRGPGAKLAWLLGLLQTADQTMARLLALTEALESAVGQSPWPTHVTEVLAVQLRAIAGAAEALAAFAVDEDEATPVPKAAIDPADVEGALKAHSATMTPLAVAQGHHLAELLHGIDQVLETVTPVRHAESAGERPVPWFSTLRAALSKDSVERRHALRVGLLVAASVGVTNVWAVDHGYWATITMLVVLQPHGPATTLRIVQRVGGTVLGALLAVGLATLFPQPKQLIVVCMVMSAVSVSVLQVNYGLYAALLTPTFVLLAQLNGLHPGLAALRAGMTAVAGLAALVASRLVWPTSERARVADELAVALRALRGLLEVLARVPKASDAEMSSARRAFGVAMINADVSFQRLVAEHAVGAPELEPVMTMLLYLRRLCWAAIAVPTLPGAPSLPAETAQALEGLLTELALAASERRKPEPLGTMGLGHETTDPLLQRQLDRMVQHVRVLHDAQSRNRWAS